MFTAQRHIDTRAITAFRPTISAEARRAHTLRSAWTDCAEMSVRRSGARLVIAGRYDRSAIMRAALAAARSRQGVNGAPWAVCLADALRGVWKVARAQRGTVRPVLAH